MSAPYLDLTVAQVGTAAGLVVFAEILGLVLRLRMRGELVVAALRTTIQLVLVGYVLRWVFSRPRPLITIALLVPMTIVAGVAAVRRTPLRYPGIFTSSIVAVALAGWLISAFGVLVVVQPRPWWTPQYAIPLAGIVLGSTLTGISLSIDRFGGDLSARRAHVEMLLTLGATRWEAARPVLAEAIRAGMIPTLNAMMVAGVVNLPGTMTGQLIAGVDPLSAAEYQIVIMFLIAAAAQLGTVAAVLMMFTKLFNRDHQLLRERLSRTRALEGEPS
jgi:putative ABC transport system permease protein